MAYVTQADLEKRFVALKLWTDDDASGAIDAANVAQAIGDAEAQIDAAAAQHYATPLGLGHVTTAAVVRNHAAAIAGYLLASRVSADNVPENLRLLYDDALKWLERLRSGKEALAGESAAEVARPSGGIVMHGDDAIVTRDSMDGL